MYKAGSHFGLHYCFAKVTAGNLKGPQGVFAAIPSKHGLQFRLWSIVETAFTINRVKCDTDVSGFFLITYTFLIVQSTFWMIEW